MLCDYMKHVKLIFKQVYYNFKTCFYAVNIIMHVFFMNLLNVISHIYFHFISLNFTKVAEYSLYVFKYQTQSILIFLIIL